MRTLKIVEYCLGPEPVVNGRLVVEPGEDFPNIPNEWKYVLEEMDEMNLSDFRTYNFNLHRTNDNPERWGIIRFGGQYCLNKQGEAEYQRSPSSRDDDFYERCRFSSVEEAVEFFDAWKAKIKKEYVPPTRKNNV